MSDWIIYIAIAMASFALGSLAKGFVANAERKIKEDQAELEHQEARRNQHKDFMDVADTIEDYKIQVSAASLYLTHGQKAAYAFIVEELQKTKE